jgi:hypothetical protein
VEQTSGAQGGRPTLAYDLNRKQAIYIITKYETEEATDITIEVIERFDAYERGDVWAQTQMSFTSGGRR